MDYVFDLPIPAETVETLPKWTEILAANGIVRQVRILFPSGSAGLSHVRILHNFFQVWPSTPDVWYRGDDMQIVFTETYLMDDGINRITVQGYNEDDTFSHAVIVSLVVEPITLGWRSSDIQGMGYEKGKMEWLK